MNCNNNQNNNNGCGCNCNPHPTLAPEPVDINMSVCDRDINMLPMLQTYTTKVLKPNIDGCCKKNILKQCMMNCENYKYVIKWDFDLNGQTITVPENCILEFDGGSLKNGTIVGQNTVFINVGDVDIWGENLTREGTWREHSGGGGGSEEDKPYDPEAHSGLGRKTLQLKEGSNILTQEDFDQANTIYIVGYDFDLNGADILIPEGCVLEFEGGSFSNGKLISNATEVIGVLPEGNNVYQGVYYKNGKTLNYNFKETSEYSLGIMSGFITPGEKLGYAFYPQSIIAFYYNNTKYYIFGGNTSYNGTDVAHLALFSEYFEYIGSAEIPGYYNHGGGLAIRNDKLYLSTAIREKGDKHGIYIFSLADVMNKCTTDTIVPHPFEYSSQLIPLDYIVLPYHCGDLDYDKVNDEFVVLGVDTNIHIYDKDFNELRYFDNPARTFLNEKYGMGGTNQGIVLKNGICYISFWVYDAFTGGTASCSAAIIQYDTINNEYVDVKIIKSPYARSEPEGLCADPDDDNAFWFLYGMSFYSSEGSYIAIAKASQIDTELGGNSIGGNDTDSIISSGMPIEYYVDNTYDFSNGYSTGQGNKPFKSIETAIVMAINGSSESIINIRNTDIDYGCGPIKVGAGKCLVINGQNGKPTINTYGRWWCFGGILKIQTVNIVSHTDIALRIGNNGYLYFCASTVSVPEGQLGVYVYDSSHSKFEGDCAITGGTRGIRCFYGILRVHDILTLNQNNIGFDVEFGEYFGNTIEFNGCTTALRVRYADFKSRMLHFTGCTTCFNIDDSKIQIPGEGHITIDTCTTVAFKDTTWRNPSNILKTIYAMEDFNTIVNIVKKGEVSNSAVGFVVNNYIKELVRGEYYYNGTMFIHKGSGIPVTLYDTNKTIIPAVGTLSDMPIIPNDDDYVGVKFFNTDINKYMYWNGNNWVVEGGVYTKIGELDPSSTTFDGHAVTVVGTTYNSDWEYWTHGNTIYRKVFDITGDPFNTGDIICVKIRSAKENFGLTANYVLNDVSVATLFDYTASEGFNKSDRLGQVPAYTSADLLRITVNCDIEYFDGKIEIYKVE